MITVEPNDTMHTVLVISEKGQGKRTELAEYRETNRGGKGVKTLQVTEKTGKVFTIKAVEEEDDIMITSKEGITIRMHVKDISVIGRATQGVRVIKLGKKDEIADVALVKFSEDDEEDYEDADIVEEGSGEEE